MDSRLLALLPSELVTEVAAVEEAIGSTIGIKAPPKYDPLLSRRPELVAIETGMIAGRSYANLLIPTGVDLKAHTLAHEVMHAYRNLVQRVWRLIDASGQERLFPTMIENDLEHLFIVPRELDLFPEARVYWEAEWTAKVTQQAFEDLQQTERPFDALAMRGNLLRLSLTLEQVLPDLPAREVLLQGLATSGLSRDAENLSRSYHKADGSKPALAAMSLRFARLPFDRFRLARYLPAARTIETRAIPQR